MKIDIQLLPREKRRQTPFYPDQQLVFGKERTDHMFLADYENGVWKNHRIVPYGPLNIAPGAVVLHYAQEVFEGAKAFLHADGELYTFRIDENAKRLNRSAEILCMPHFPIEDQITAIHALLDIDRLSYPMGQEGASMYIRPFLFGTSDAVGVKPSLTYTYCVILSPVGPYYAEGFKPITLLITDKFHRAAKGGSGEAKAGGNYAASLRAGQHAKGFGASQVLFLDSTNCYIEEAGAMNHYHVTKDRKVVIPEFTDTILKSITSRSILELKDRFDFQVCQEHILLKEFCSGIDNGTILEAGGFGTAACVSPVGTYVLEDGTKHVVNGAKIGLITQTMYNTLTGIQKGTVEAPRGWLQKVERQH